MAEISAIEWTDSTWNPVRGCTKVSPGCRYCYALTFAERWRGIPGHPYEQGFDLRLVPEKLEEPLKWKSPRRIFVNSMSDLFHEGVPEPFIRRVFGVAFFFKQWGGRRSKAGGRRLDGREWNQMPLSLHRVQTRAS